MATGKTKYENYIESTKEDIVATIHDFGCQPILFVGSGLSRRYMNAPNWYELLEILAKQCSTIDKGLGFYEQALITPMAIGEEFARLFQEWAWAAGQNEFPKEMFDKGMPAQSYIKYKISEALKNITPKSVSDLTDLGNSAEILALQKIKPHAIITTNYDQMLELIFPDLAPIIGQQILKGQQYSFGEIFKIHGCVSESNGIVFTQSDYDEFKKKKKYLSAKLLTFFNEHPLIFIGYRAGDPNIQAILSDIDEALPEKGGVIPNVYILEWNKGINADTNPPRDKVIATEDGRSVRVKLIEADDFGWVFESFAATPALSNVNPKILRALIARSYNFIRHDVPKIHVDADFQMLTKSVEDSTSFAKIFGIATVDDYSAAAVSHPFSITDIGKKLGGKQWHIADKMIKKLDADSGINIKASDNRYHRCGKLNKSNFHWYSQEAFELLSAVMDGTPYSVDI